MKSVDDMVGALVATLRSVGALSNTYLVFSSDNGYHMGEHRLAPGKLTAFDTDIRCPWSSSGRGPPGLRIALVRAEHRPALHLRRHGGHLAFRTGRRAQPNALVLHWY